MIKGKRFKTIYADPPWDERWAGRMDCAFGREYPLMKTRDIIDLPVPEISDDNAHLYLWVTNNRLIDGLEVMTAWGFRYITKITWFKENSFGLGQYFRGKTEDCLFGIKGNLPPKDDKKMKGITAIFTPRGRHSEKPEDMRAMIEKVSYGPYIELFARKRTPGWYVWGNQVPEERE